MQMIKRAKWSYILISALLIALGACVIVRPGISAQTLCLLIGTLCILFGIAKCSGYLARDQYGLAFQFDLALGILALVIGILLCAHPGGIVRLVPFMVGQFILTDGVFKVQTAVDAKRFGLARWWSILLLALLCMAGGILLMVSPTAGAKVLMMLLGLALAVDGAQNLAVVLYTVRESHEKTTPADDVRKE